MSARRASQAPGRRTFHTLDALRGIAALAVVLFHAGFFYGIAAPAEGQVAVDLFFVMSGFIIAYRYDSALEAGLGTVAFLKRRLIRLYPLFFLGTLLGVVPALLAIAAGDNTPFYRGLLESLPLAGAMLPSPLVFPTVQEVYPLNYVAWSLALEILINVAYAATFRFWTVRRLAGLILIGFAALVLSAARYGGLDVGFAWPHYAGGFARVLFGFACGVMIFRCFDRGVFASFPAGSLLPPWWLLLPVVAILFFIEPPFFKAAWELGLVAVVVPAVVIAAIASEPPPWVRPLCAWAGVASYVVYSLHAPLIGLFLRLEVRFGFDKNTASAGTALAFTGLLLASCIAAHCVYDKPVRRWLARDAGQSGVRRSHAMRGRTHSPVKS